MASLPSRLSPGRNSSSANDNMATRHVGSQTFTLAYDVENRLIEVKKNDVTTLQFTYDGDGVRAEERYFVGTTLTSMKAYFPSTSLRAGLPFGEVRTIPDSPITVTDFGFTGQRDLGGDLGLMDYRARFYSQSLGRFLQPDTIIPSLENPQAWNRYAYTLNNPLRYTDPTGHRPCNDSNNGTCTPYTQADQINDLKLIIKDQFRWTVKGNDWTLKELETIYQTGNDILAYADEMTGGNGLYWMHYAFGNTTIEHVGFTDGHSDTMPFLGENFGSRIRLNDNWLKDGWGASVVFAHELGHVWDINSGFTYSGEMNRNLGGSSWCFFCAPGNGVPQWRPEYHGGYGNSGRNEYFAEAFAATVYSPGIVPAGASEWIRLQMLQDVLRYLFPGGLQ